MKKYTILGLSLVAMPMLVFAKTLTEVMATISGLIATAMPIIISLAIIYFIWSLVQFLLKEGEDKAAAKTSMIWGIIILFVMISVWGLVNLLDTTFELDKTAPTVDWVIKK